MKNRNKDTEELKKLRREAAKAAAPVKGIMYKGLLEVDEDTVTLQNLYDLPYNEAKKTISILSAEKKLTLISEISTLTTVMYQKIKDLYQTKAFPKADDLIMTPRDYHRTMSRIKHLETIAEFIYETSLSPEELDILLDTEF